ncbi:MAG: sigma-70 family RNA polymerase sigma factor [Tissierellia bacterium]|nr:sigma-70 family RNA polymerase sigma factor [Tissierellia bacterium]
MDQDTESIKRTLSGDEDAFEDIVDRYKGYVFAIILNFIKDYDEAENILQEVFIQVYISLPEYRMDNFKGWISRIATNKSIDWIRKKRSKFREETMEDSESIMDMQGIQDGESPEDILMHKENRQSIRRICSSIPDIYEDVIIKFYFEGKSYKEIAKEEGTTVKTIASRLYRGRNILREKWRE